MKCKNRFISVLSAALLCVLPGLPAFGAVMVEENIYPAGEGVETFDWAVKPGSWTGFSSGGVCDKQPDEDDTANNAFKIQRTKDAGGLNQTFKVDSPITAGTFGVEFDVKMRGVDDKLIEVLLRSSANKAIASYQFRQNDGVYVRQKSNGSFEKVPGTDGIMLAGTDDYVHIKITVSMEEKHMETTVNDSFTHVVDGGFVDNAATDFNAFFFQSQASAAANGAGAYFDNFRVFRMVEQKTDQDAVDEDAAALDLGDLTGLDHDVPLPSSGANSTVITWETSDESVITAAGEINVGPAAGSAVLTATVRKNDATAIKSFPVTVISDITRAKLTWVSTDDFSGASIPSTWQSAAAVMEDGRLILSKTSSAAAAATRNISSAINGDLFIEHDYTMNASAGGKGLQEQLRGVNDAGTIVTLMVLRYMQDGSLSYRSGNAQYTNLGGAELVRRGETHKLRYRVNLITQTLDVSVDGRKLLDNVPFPSTADTISSVTATYWTSGENDFPTHIEIGSYRVGVQERYQQIVENDLAALAIPNADAITDDFTLAMDGALGSAVSWTSDNAAVEIGEGGQAEVTRPPSDAADVTVNLTATATRGAYSDTRRLSVTVKREMTVPEALDDAKRSLTEGVLLGKNEDLTQVTSSLELPAAWTNGTAVSWRSSSPVIAVKGEAGVVNGNLLDEDEPSRAVTLTATLSKEGQTAEKVFTVTVLNPGFTNIAAGKSAKASSALSTNLAGLAVDGKAITAWAADASDKNPYLRIDLGKTLSINRIELTEKNSVMRRFRIETSQNGTNWTLLASGTAIGDKQTWSYTLPEPVLTKYLRYYVAEKDAGETGLYELAVFKRYSDEVRVAEDLANIEIPNQYALSSDVSLPNTGENGTQLTWETSDAGVISDTGRVTRAAKDKSATLTVTGRLNDASRKRAIPVTVSGTGGSGGSSGGGGGGGGSYVGGQRNDSTYLPPAILPPAPTPEPEPQSVFSDVPAGHWAREYVETLYSKGVIGGVDADHFAPDRTLTRAEFVKMLVGAFGIGEGVYSGGYDDVSADDWYAGYIAAARTYGIASGVEEHIFGANEPVSRQDMAVMAANAAQACGKAVPGGNAPDFTDGGEIASYALGSVNALAAAGILSGTPEGAFDPAGGATRAQAAKVLCVLLEKAVSAQ